jgi:hypothetical protein
VRDRSDDHDALTAGPEAAGEFASDNDDHHLATFTAGAHTVEQAVQAVLCAVTGPRAALCTGYAVGSLGASTRASTQALVKKFFGRHVANPVVGVRGSGDEAVPVAHSAHSGHPGPCVECGGMRKAGQPRAPHGY